MTARDATLRTRFCDAEQGHVFRFFDELPAEEQDELLTQLRAIDLKRLKVLIETHLAGGEARPLPPITPGPVIPIPSTPAEKREETTSRRAGEDALRAGRVAALVVAGGQATRLGYHAPKGTFPVTPVTRKPLFALHAEKVLALSRRFGRRIPLLVLVSPENDAATRRFFEEHDRFGLDASDVLFFAQAMLPAVDRDGRLLLSERGRIFVSPDGHGGVFNAIHQSGVLDELARRGIDTVYYFQVDNPLAKVADPVFLGHHLRQRADFSLKVVRKRDAAEKVGVYALIGGKPGIVEYSDLGDELRDACETDGSLTYWAGNIAIHAFGTEFLRRLGSGEAALPYHLARKKIPYVDERGEQRTPSEANGIKFESFVFDALPLARRVVAMEVARAEEFAPVKNKLGEDSPATSMRAQSELFRSWLAGAGFEIGDPEAAIEIGPLFALDREELEQRLRRERRIGVRRLLLD